MPAPFTAFVKHLLETGEAHLPARFETTTGRAELSPLLAAAFARHALDVAGPAIPFDEERAVAAAELVAWACWCTAMPTEALDPVERAARLLAPRGEASAAAHLSVDLALRFAAQLERRARAKETGSRLAVLLAETLRRWPLTGALSEVAEPPLAGRALGGHAGLELLYEERLAANPKPAWAPAPDEPAPDEPATEEVSA